MAGRQILSRSVELSSEPYFDKPCVICRKSGKHVQATSTCLDCNNTLCGKCLQDHNKFDIMKGHRVVDKAMSVKGPVSLPTMMCEHHGGKLVDMYCPQHDQVCCSACIAIHHRGCDAVDYVPSISAGTKTSPELQTVIQDINTTMDELQQRKKERENDKKRIADEKDRADRNVEESTQRIINAVNKLKQKSLDTILERFNQFQQNVDDDLQKINDAIVLLGEHVRYLQSVTHDNESQMFVVMKRGKAQREVCNELNEGMGAILKREALYFNVEHKIEENILKLEMLGNLETPFTTYSEYGKYNVRLKGDKSQCCIRGICSMSDGKILLADRDNEKLKRLDTSYTLLDHCKLPGRPSSICLTGSTEVVIALGKQQMIQFVSVEDKMTPTRSFSVGEACRCVAYSRGQLFITCGGETSEGQGEVRVYNTEGKLLHKLPQQTPSTPTWTCPTTVGLSPDGMKVFVTDYDYGLVTMDRDGNNVNKHSIAASTLCKQKQCIWFVKGTGNKTIYQVNSEGNNLGLLMQDGLEHQPGALFFQENDNKLIVGFWYMDYIKVFKLCK